MVLLIILAAQEVRVALGYYQIPQQSASISKWVLRNRCGNSWDDDLNCYSLLDSIYYLALQLNLIQQERVIANHVVY